MANPFYLDYLWLFEIAKQDCQPVVSGTAPYTKHMEIFLCSQSSFTISQVIITFLASRRPGYRKEWVLA